MHKFTLCFVCAFFAFAASAQVRLSWNNRIEAPADYNAVVFRGESVVLEAALTQYGVALPLDGTATLYYAVAGTTNFTASAASISGNKLIALWTPELDSGAARYTFFLSANMSGGRIYRANGSITLQSSPGAYPPIIAQTGPTLVSLQDGLTAAGNTNAAQGVSIAALQQGQASLTGQVNAALAMSYAAGDQATVARNTANAAALTAGVARTTGSYLAATQAVHTATLSGLSIASTNTHRIATNAEALATAAFNRPSGTDTGTVSGLIVQALATNGSSRLYDAAHPVRYLTITGTVLNVDTGIRLYKPAPFSITFATDVFGQSNWWTDNTPRLLISAGTYTANDSGIIALPSTPGTIDGNLFVSSMDPLTTNEQFTVSVSINLRDAVLEYVLEPLVLNHTSGGSCVSVDAPSWVGLSFSAQLLEMVIASTEYDLASFPTRVELTNQINTRLPKLSIYDTNTSANVTAVIRSVFTNGYNRLFLIQE